MELNSLPGTDSEFFIVKEPEPVATISVGDLVNNELKKLLSDLKPDEKIFDLRRWNFEADDEGLLVCRGDHDRSSHCKMEPLSPQETLEILELLRSECLRFYAKLGAFNFDSEVEPDDRQN